VVFSVIIPVLNGEEYLAEVLEAVLGQQTDAELEVLVIDSGSTDRSLEIARDAGVNLIEIPNSEFQHGRTRNFGMRNTRGELVAFLTQDATPASPHWVEAYREAFRLDDHVGAAYGPHLPRPGVNPLMARLLTEFFAGFSPEGGPVVHHKGDLTFLSNSNSCLSRAAWQQIPFRAIPYAEDQAMGADLLEAGWTKVYMPEAAALHSHDYGLVESWKRYFDEYRGLRESIGHVEKASATGAARVVAGSVRSDARWIIREEDRPPHEKAYWIGHSVAHHAGKVVFGGLGSRADKVPPLVRRAMSLERRSDGILRPVEPFVSETEFESVRQLHKHGAEPLRAMRAHDDGRKNLHIAWVVPPFSVGGGGHMTIFRIVKSLEQRGHRCSIWVDDPHGLEKSSAGLGRRVREHFQDVAADVQLGFAGWTGADVAVATGWQTVYPTMRLPGCAERAYLVQDFEPDFYPASSERVFAEHTYQLGLKCIAASPWLAQQLRDRYDADATPFSLGVDHGEYTQVDIERSANTVVYYARNFTARRAVELGILALQEVVERRPQTKIVFFGTDHIIKAPFTFEHLGVVGADRLRQLYSEATVGLSTSLTNYSLIPTEMMACGLPVVELAGRACESVFGPGSDAIALAQDDPVDIADHICALLDDPQRWERQSHAGLEFVAGQSWENAFAVVADTLTELFAERVRTELVPKHPKPAMARAGTLI
jgi:glycosyltransferase involved in cell wall biosynthesis